MGLFFGYILPITLLISGLLIFKKLFVKCIKDDFYWNKKIIREPITFPVWIYILYFIGTFMPILNWFMILGFLLLAWMGDYFSSYSWTNRDYWYEIPEETINNALCKIGNFVENLINKKWFFYLITPFVYMCKIMSKRI